MNPAPEEEWRAQTGTHGLRHDVQQEEAGLQEDTEESQEHAAQTTTSGEGGK